MNPREFLEHLRLKGVVFEEKGLNLAAIESAPQGHVKVPVDPLAPKRKSKPPKPKMSEAEFQTEVIGLAHAHGWKVAHFRKVRVQRKDGSVYWETPVAADGKGFMDLILVHAARGKIAAVELKVPPNKPSDEQLAWLDAFASCLIPAFLWYPRDWDEIQEFLS